MYKDSIARLIVLDSSKLECKEIKEEEKYDSL